MKRTAEHSLAIGFGLITLLTTIMVYVGLRTSARHHELTDAITHTHDVLTQIQRTRFSLSNTEIDKFRFFVTGEPRFLQARQATLSTLETALLHLERLTADNPVQKANIHELRIRIGRRMTMSNEMILQRKQEQITFLKARILSGRGEKAIQAIEEVFLSMEGEEVRLLHLRQARWQAQTQQASTLLLCLCLGVGILGSVMFISIYLVERARKQATIGLREAKRFAESVCEHSTSIIYVFDIDTMTKTYASRDMAAFLGYSQEQIAAMEENFLPSLVHPDDLPYFLGHLKVFESFKDGQTIEFEQRVRHASGEWRWFWHHEVVFKRHDNGSPFQIMGTAHDITDRKRSEEALRRSQENLNIAQAMARIGSWESDVLTRTTSWSEEMFRLFGREVATQTPSFEEWLQWTHPEDTLRVNQCLAAALTCGTPFEAEYRIVLPNGNVRTVAALCRPVFDEAGRVERLRGTVMDITERKQVEAALLVERERLASVVTTQYEIAVAPRELEGIMTLAVERTQQLTGADGVAIALLEGENLAFHVASAEAERFLGQAIPLEGSLAGLCVQRGEALMCEEVATDPRVNGTEYWHVGINSIVVAPLLQFGEIVGVLKVYSHSARAFDAADIQTLSLMAGLITAAMSHTGEAEARQALLNERTSALEQVQQSEARFRAATEGSLDAFYLLESVRDDAGQLIDFVFVDMNQRAEWLITMPTTAVVGQMVGALSPTYYERGIFAQYAAVVESRQAFEAEYQPNNPLVDADWLRVQVVPVDDGVAVTARDISEEKRMENALLTQIATVNEARVQLEVQADDLQTANTRLEMLATTDGLTGLKNHRTFQERLNEEFQRAMRYSIPLSLILLDVDKFKVYNDTFGHPAGDAVLKTVAQILQTTARTTDIVARYGGEEFVVVLPETDTSGATDAAERIRTAIEAFPWTERPVTASLGVSTLSLLVENTEQLIARADNALYYSKQQGRNRVSHAANMPEENESDGMGDVVSLLPVLARQTEEELSRAYNATIAGWSQILDMRDHETEGHSERVTEMAVRLGQQMGLDEAQIVYVRWGALLHDIGKMGVPDNILFKPGALTEEEWQIMRRHPALAHTMLSPISFLSFALDIPYCHHEKWDGSGYPRGLKGEEIPLAARLFAVVDVWDALRSDRPYRAAWPEHEVLAHLRAGAGSHFDPDVVHAFLELLGSKEKASPEVLPGRLRAAS